MSNKLAVCVGIDEVYGPAFNGWTGKLNACEFDCNDMSNILRAEGYAVKQLLTKHATADAVLGALRDAVTNAYPGDHIVYTQSSHGTQVKDYDGDEDDGQDEALVMYDDIVDDDQFRKIWSLAKPGVKITTIVDACHSEDSMRSLVADEYAKRTMPRDVARALMTPERIAAAMARKSVIEEIRADMACFSACQTWETASDGLYNGAYTGAFRAVWANGAFKGCMLSMHRMIQRKLANSGQHPTLAITGPDFWFQFKRPFEI